MQAGGSAGPGLSTGAFSPQAPELLTCRGPTLPAPRVTRHGVPVG